MRNQSRQGSSWSSEDHYPPSRWEERIGEDPLKLVPFQPAGQLRKGSETATRQWLLLSALAVDPKLVGTRLLLLILFEVVSESQVNTTTSTLGDYLLT